MFSDEETVRQYDAYFNTNGETEDYKKIILPYFCASQNVDTPATPCPDNPFAIAQGNLSQRMSSCSKMISSDLCKELRYDRSDISDNSKLAYCGAFNTIDCLCINREENPFYRLVTSTTVQPTDAACWWTPCSDFLSKTYLVTDALSVCSGDDRIICNQVQVVLSENSSGTTIDTNFYTECGPTNSSPNGGPEIKLGTLWGKYWWVLVIVMVVVFIILLLLIILL
jgi:hypothetical protein